MRWIRIAAPAGCLPQLLKAQLWTCENLPPRLYITLPQLTEIAGACASTCTGTSGTATDCSARLESHLPASVCVRGRRTMICSPSPRTSPANWLCQLSVARITQVLPPPPRCSRGFASFQVDTLIVHSLECDIWLVRLAVHAYIKLWTSARTNSLLTSIDSFWLRTLCCSLHWLQVQVQVTRLRWYEKIV